MATGVTGIPTDAIPHGRTSWPASKAAPRSNTCRPLSDRKSNAGAVFAGINPLDALPLVLFNFPEL